MRILNNITLLLKEKNKTQKSLTDYLGLSKNIFTDWKSGKCKSYNAYLPQIAEFFDVSIDELVGNNDRKSPNYTYAAYDELTRELSPEQIKQLVDFANYLRNKNK